MYSYYLQDVSDPNQMNQIRGMTGVCLQHNILLDCLTAAEHLEFFGGLKGLTGDYLKLQVRFRGRLFFEIRHTFCMFYNFEFELIIGNLAHRKSKYFREKMA